MNDWHRCLLPLLLVSACGSDDPREAGLTPQPIRLEIAVQEQPEFLSDPLLAASLFSVTPRITYKADYLQQAVNRTFIEQQWLAMQTCLGVSAVPPEVVVSDGWVVVPDGVQIEDVLYSLEGRVLAASHPADAAMHTIHISSYDFDGSQGEPAFHLRSIFGRFLWQRNELPPGGYNTGCITNPAG